MVTTGIALASHAPIAVEVTLRINGVEYSCQFDTRVTLLDALRDYIGLTSSTGGQPRRGLLRAVLVFLAPATASAQSALATEIGIEGTSFSVSATP